MSPNAVWLKSSLQTIGGSLATASRLADVNVLLLASDSRVKIASAGEISMLFEFRILDLF